MISLPRDRAGSILDVLDEGITVQDHLGRLVYANAAACQLMGFDSPEAFLSLPISDVLARFEVFDEAGAPFSFADLPGRRLMAGESPAELRLKFRIRGQSTERWSVVRAIALRGQDGQIELVVNLFRDVTHRRAQEEALRVSQRWFSTTLRSIGDAVIATDEAGVVQFVNPVAEALTGWPIQEAVGRPLREVFSIVSEEDRQPIESPVERAIQHNAIVGLANHTLLLRRDGTELSIDDSAAPIRNDDGTLVGVVLVFRDVSERRREELRREYLSRAAEELASSLDYHQTLATVAQLAVPQVADWCAVDIREGEELRRLAVAHIDEAKLQLVQDIQRRYPPDRKTSGAWRVLDSGEPYCIPDIPEALLEASARDPEHLQMIRRLGLVSYLAVPLMHEEQPIGVLTFATAESKRRYGDQDLALAQALAERASLALKKATLFGEQVAARQLLEAARRQAEEASQSKDAFLAMLGHELRNPLGPILTALQLVKMRGVLGIDRELAVLDRQVRHVTRLVDDLLDLARINRGQFPLHRQQVELSEVVAQAAELSAPLFEQRLQQLQLQVPQGAFVHADATRLVQVISNLLTNAALYSEPHGQVELSVERSGEVWELRVTDQGRGVSPEMLQRIFEPFVQERQGAERARGGLGLGLAIARRLTELHGGTLQVFSAGPGQGSTFLLRLPVAPQASDQTMGLGAVVAPLAPARLLVVDDNDDARELLALALEHEGHTVDRAHDGPSALLLAAEHLPQLAILDIGLPVMDGYELAQRLRADPRLASIRLVALTGYGQAQDRQRALEAGFDEHLVKPIRTEQLGEIIRRLVPQS
jgi:PAS domain S-box-containing protein